MEKNETPDEGKYAAMLGKRFELRKVEAHCLQLELAKAEQLRERADVLETKAYSTVEGYVLERLGFEKGVRLKFLLEEGKLLVEIAQIPEATTTAEAEASAKDAAAADAHDKVC